MGKVSFSVFSNDSSGPGNDQINNSECFVCIIHNNGYVSDMKAHLKIHVNHSHLCP